MKKIKIISIITLILVMIMGVFLYFNFNQQKYNKNIENINLNASITNNGATMDIPEYNASNGWALGEIKDVNITVDFGDETSEGKRIEFTLPEGIEYVQIPAFGIIEGDQNHYSTVKVDEENPLNEIIKKTILPEIHTVGYRKIGKVIYEIKNNVRRATITVKARLSAAVYYKPMEIPKPIVLEGFKGNLKINTVEMKVKGVGSGGIVLPRFYQDEGGFFPRTTEGYASTDEEDSYAYGYRFQVRSYRPQYQEYGNNTIYLKNIKLHLYMPRNMKFDKFEWTWHNFYTFVNGKIEIDKQNSKVIISADYVGQILGNLRYKIPKGITPGLYEAVDNDYMEYETYDGVKHLTRFQNKNRIRITDRSNFINKLYVESLGDYRESKTKGGAYIYNDDQSYVNRNAGFIVRNQTPGYKKNQTVEYTIDPSIEMIRVRFPYDPKIITNTVPTYVEYKTANNPNWTRAEVKYKVFDNSIELKASEFPLLKEATALRVNIGTIGSDYKMFYSQNLDARGGLIQTMQRLRRGWSEGKYVIELYDNANKPATIARAEYILKLINENENKFVRGFSENNIFNSENQITTTLKWGYTFTYKKNFRIVAYPDDKIKASYLRNPTIYIRQPEGIEFDEESIKLYRSHNRQDGESINELPHPYIKEVYNIGNGNKVIKIVPVGDFTSGEFLDDIDSLKYTVGNIEIKGHIKKGASGSEEIREIVTVEGRNINWEPFNDHVPVVDKYDVNKNGNTTEKMLSSISKVITFQENRNVNVNTEVVMDGKKYIYTAGDNTTIPKFTAQTDGIYDIKLNNWSTGAAQSVEIYIPVPKTGMNFGPNFQKEEFKFDMNLTEIKNLPANYIVEYSKNASSADNYQTALYEQNVDNLSDVTMIRIKNKTPIPENQEDRISIGMRINETYENAVENNKNGKINIFNPVIKVNSPTYEGTLKGTTAAAKLFIPKIKGIVFSDNNGDGISNGEIDRLNNITVELYKENTKIADTTTNVKGEFSFDENQIKDETNYEIRVTRPNQKFITWKNEEAGNEEINSDAEKGEGNYDVIKNINPVEKSSGDLGIGYISLKSEATLPELRIDKTIIKQGESIGINFGIPIENHKKAIKNLTDSGYRLEFNGGSENAGNVEVTEIGDTYTAPSLNPGEKERIIKIYKTATLDGTEEVGEPITIRVVTNVPPTVGANEITAFVGDNEEDYKTIVSAQNVASENIELTDDNFVVENLAPVADGKYTQAGTYKITYKVKDEYGNEAIKESKIKVNESAKIVTKDIVVDENNLNDLDTNIRASWKRAGNEIGEAEEVDLTNSITKIVTGPTQDFSKPGEYTVRYSVEAGGRTVEKEIKVVVISANDVKNGNYTLVAKDIEIEQKEALTITKDQILEKTKAIVYKEENNIINKIADGQTLNKEKFEIENAKIEEIKGTKPSGKEYTLRITANDGEMTISKEIKVKVKADAGKISAINELDQKANEKIAEIRVRQDLTSEEKTAAEAQINGILNSAKEEIDGADTEEKVNTAKNNRISEIDGVNPTAEAKTNAVRELETQANEKIAEIRERQDLTEEEKTEAIAKVNQKLNEAKSNVNSSETNSEVENIKNTGISAINGVNVSGTIKATAINELEEKANEKIEEIKVRQDLTEEEKTEAEAQINEILNNAKDKIEKADTEEKVNAAKNTGISAIDGVNPEGTVKKNAIAELERKADEKIAEIKEREDLTNEEKSAAEAQINEILNNAKDRIEKAETNEKVNTAKNTGISSINEINPVGTVKKNAIVELEQKVAEKIAEIKAKTNLTKEEKEEIITKTNQKLEEAKDAIKNAQTNENVENTKESYKNQIELIRAVGNVKRSAIEEIERKATEKIAEIDERQDLTNEEKQTGKSLVEIAKNNAKAEINESNTNAEVIDAKTRGIAAIDEINPSANVKENARKLIDEALKSKKNTIEASNNLTNEEKNKIIKEIEEIAKNGKLAVSDLETNAEVLAKTEEIINQITSKEIVGKVKSDAIAELEAKANQKIAEIKEKQDLTKEEKEEAIREIQEKLNNAKQEIQNSKTNDEVEAAKINGLDEIENINPEGKVKPEVIAELERKVAEKIAEVNTREDLTDEEKAELISKILNGLGKAKEAINKAKTNDEVNKIKEKIQNEISNLDIEDKAKSKAIEELKKLLEEKKKEIDFRKDLTKEEKEELKAKLDEEYKKSVEAINKAKTNAEIQKILEDFKVTLNQTDMVGIKTEILKELEILINKQKEEIDNRKDLTEEEKEVIKRLLDDKLNEAKRRLYEAETKEEVEKIKQELIDYINNPNIDQNLIDNLVQKLEEEAKKAKEKIDARTDITEEEKAKLKKEIDEKLERQKNILNNFNKGKIIVKYIDIQSKEEIAENIEIQKVIGETYKVEPKTFKYHVLVETPEKEEGIVELGTKTLEYKYRRKIFNFEVNTELNNASIDGKELNLNNKKISKIELTRKQIENSKLVVKYKINVSNPGEIRGKGKLEINLPKGFKLVENSMFKINGNKIRTEEFELGINENKEFNLELEWINGKDEFGTIDLAAEIVETQNEANYEETNSEKENKGKRATILLAVKTGEKENIVIGLVGLITVAISIAVLKRNK